MTNEEKRDVVRMMKDAGLLEYGATVSGEAFREMFGIKMPEVGTKSEFDAASLEELSCAGFIKDMLLNEGKYFKSERDGYRVLLPSENEQQIIAYMTQADKKLKRGLKLNKNSPKEGKVSSNDTARMIMKRESIRESR